MPWPAQQLATLTLILLALFSCSGPSTLTPSATQAIQRTGQEIVICGQLIPIGVPVVLWSDPGGYNAYSTLPHFARPGAPAEPRLRYGQRTRPVYLGPDEAWTIPTLAHAVDQFVIHYDAAGTSRQCFRILHDVRSLSIHFMLDLDGTIYQTLDVQERAFHATIANDRSIGIEIAHIGAYPPADAAILDTWYTRDARGPLLTLPQHMGDGGLRTPGFMARPATIPPTGVRTSAHNPDAFTGIINNVALIQYDFTPEQYHALARLLAALNTALPQIAISAPRDAAGRILTRALTPDEFAAHRGILGHYHVQANKSDPGPAFDWERVLREASAVPVGR